MLVTTPTSSSLNVMTTEDSMSDDVFESPEETAMSVDNRNMMAAPGLGTQQLKTPSPTGYRDYKPPAEMLRQYEPIDDSEQIVHKVCCFKTVLSVLREGGRK
ncbi:hypothetical protein C0J52_27307 [Blattella germanica]|nr:hypothetical protein C0J52_27307 [Blattella germanica]